MGYELWLSRYTGLRRKGTTFKEIEDLFINQITTKFITEPLYSCERNINAADVKHQLLNRDFDFVGIHDDNKVVIGYCSREELQEGLIDQYFHPFDLDMLIADSTALCKLFVTLRDRPFAFVLSWNKVCGIVTKWDINKPVIRIYLFGIISLFELHLNYWIDSSNPEGAWAAKVKEERLDAAHKAMQLKKGNNDKLTLLECLQIADKKEILRQTPEFLELFEFSKASFKSLLEKVETIRNELMHSQNSIIANLDWKDFVDTVMSIEKFLKTSETRIEQKVKQLEN